VCGTIDPIRAARKHHTGVGDRRLHQLRRDVLPVSGGRPGPGDGEAIPHRPAQQPDVTFRPQRHRCTITERVDPGRPFSIARDQHPHPRPLRLSKHPSRLREVDAWCEAPLPGVTIRPGWDFIGEDAGDGLGCADGADHPPRHRVTWFGRDREDDPRCALICCQLVDRIH